MGYAAILAGLAMLQYGTPGVTTQTHVSSDRTSALGSEVLLAEFADCVTAQKGRRHTTMLFLRTVPNSEGFYAAAMKAADLHCLDRAAWRIESDIQMKLQPATFRDALYPSLYRRDFNGSAPPAGIPTAPAATLSSEFDGPIATVPAAYVAGRMFGDCVVRADPQAAHDLLQADLRSPAADGAIERLKPAFAVCIGEGRTIHINRSTVRATVGEAMYKLAMSVAPPA